MCGATAGGLSLDGVDVAKEAVVQGQVVRDGEPVSNAYVRLLDRTGEFTAEVPTSATGHFRFFAGDGDWTLRTLAPRGRDRGPAGPRRGRQGRRGDHRALTTDQPQQRRVVMMTTRRSVRVTLRRLGVFSLPVMTAELSGREDGERAVVDRRDLACRRRRRRARRGRRGGEGSADGVVERLGDRAGSGRLPGRSSALARLAVQSELRDDQDRGRDVGGRPLVGEHPQRPRSCAPSTPPRPSRRSG